MTIPVEGFSSAGENRFASGFGYVVSTWFLVYSGYFASGVGYVVVHCVSMEVVRPFEVADDLCAGR